MTQIDLGYNYEAMTSNLRGFYSGAGYFGALITLDRAREKHNGLRKDGFPEFSHQIMQATMLRNLPGLMYPEMTHITVLAHDLEEDHDVPVRQTLEAICRGTPKKWVEEHLDMDRLATSMEQMNKYITGSRTPKSESYYYGEIENDPISSIAKGLDIDHNLGSMIRAFTPAKMRSYAEGKAEYGIPMLKAARKRFPSQARAYHLLDQQIEYKLFMIESYLNVVERGAV